MSYVEFEIVDEVIDQQEDQLCKQVCQKADYIDGLIDRFLDEDPAKAMAFLECIEAAAKGFIVAHSVAVIDQTLNDLDGVV